MASVDHFYVFSSVDAPELQLLSERGLRVGARRDHTGQGTRNVCIGFADCYLELIWVSDANAAREPKIARLGLDRRMHWREHNASPFGICLRPDAAGTKAPFAHWPYRPPYAPNGISIDVSNNSAEVREPMLFHIDHTFTPLTEPHELAQHTLHELVVTVPSLAAHSPWHQLQVDGLRVEQGAEHLMVIKLRNANSAANGSVDLRPTLPLTLSW